METAYGEMRIGMLSARRSTKGLKAANGRNCTSYYKEMGSVAGVKKPNENPKAKALWTPMTLNAKTTFREEIKRD